MKIPFNRCMIVTTLDFECILERLASAIYDRRLQPRYSPGKRPRKQRYFGQLRGFRFSATRTIGHKYFHLPSLLFPTITGKIDRLRNGYEISLGIELHDLTCIILLAWLGGLATFTIASIFDNVLGDVNEYQYQGDALVSLGLFLAVVAYFYFAAWRSIRFFKALFSQRLLGATNIIPATKPRWETDLRHK